MSPVVLHVWWNAHLVPGRDQVTLEPTTDRAGWVNAVGTGVTKTPTRKTGHQHGQGHIHEAQGTSLSVGKPGSDEAMKSVGLLVAVGEDDPPQPMMLSSVCVRQGLTLASPRAHSERVVPSHRSRRATTLSMTHPPTRTTCSAPATPRRRREGAPTVFVDDLCREFSTGGVPRAEMHTIGADGDPSDRECVRRIGPTVGARAGCWRPRSDDPSPTARHPLNPRVSGTWTRHTNSRSVASACVLSDSGPVTWNETQGEQGSRL